MFRLVVCGSLVALALFSCRPGVKGGGAMTAIETLGVTFAKEAKLPHTKVEATSIGTVDAANIDDWVGRIVDAMATVEKTPTGHEVRRAKDDPDYATTRPALIASFKASGQIQAGDSVIRVRWKIDGLQVFETLGLADSSLKPKFEPVLSLGAVEQPSEPLTQHHSWTVSTGSSWVNGFGVQCAQAEWQISVQTNECKITDPAPHVRLVTCSKSCWLWDIQCNDGELAYTQPNDECPGGVEDCIKFVTQATFASGTSKVEVEGTAQGEAHGVKLRLKVKTTVGSLGSSDTREHIGNVCANSDPFLDGEFLVPYYLEPGEPLSAEGGPFPPTCCRCTIRNIPDPEREGCPDRCFAPVANGTSIGECQRLAKQTTPEKCRAFYGHCGWVHPRNCQ